MLEEHVYSGSGTNQSNTYYYSLVGRLIGSKDANGTVFYMTDILGSVLASFTNVASGATLKGNQVFGPYGNARYSQGNINTAKGFTGQYNDALTGLDYYNARYYDPVAGVFLSADMAVGNGSGENPYAYVNGNPETYSDPTGHAIVVEGDVATLDGGGQLSGQETGGASGADSGGDSGSSATGNASTSNASNTLSWSTTNGNTVTQYSIDPNTGDLIYWQYRNGMLVGGGDIPDTGGSPIAVNGAVLAKLGIKFHFPDPVPGGFSINLAPQPMLPVPQISSGGSGSRGRSPGGPIAPPPGPNNPNSSGGTVTIYLDRTLYPETCGHIEDAINNGKPSVLTKDSDPQRNRLRRRAALAGYPPKPGFERDEYPMAMTLEGGAGADIRYISPSDNQGAGASIGGQLRPYSNGIQFTIKCI